MALTAVSNPKARRKPVKRAAVLVTQPLNNCHSTTRKGNRADRARQQAADAAVSTPSNQVQSAYDMEEDYGSGFELDFGGGFVQPSPPPASANAPPRTTQYARTQEENARIRSKERPRLWVQFIEAESATRQFTAGIQADPPCLSDGGEMCSKSRITPTVIGFNTSSYPTTSFLSAELVF